MIVRTAQPKMRRGQVAKPPLKDLGPDPDTEKPIIVKEGRFGLYVTDGETNASIPKGADPATTLGCITRDTCDILYRKVSEIRVTTKITITIEDFAGVSETYASNGESVIHISSRYLQQVSDAHADVAREIRGIFYYHATNIYQYDGGNGTDTAVLQGGATQVTNVENVTFA